MRGERRASSDARPLAMGGSSRRRNPNEFGASRGRGDGGRSMRHASYLHLGLDEALARGADDPTTTRDYARAADELAIVLDTCFRASDKSTATAMYESAVLAARLSSGVDTAAQADAAERVRRAACAVLPAQRRAAFEGEFKRASVERARRARRVDAEARERVDDPDRGIVIVDLPRDALDLVAARLEPHDLARAACASTDWRDAVARAEHTWRRHAEAAFGPSRCRRLAEPPEAKNASWMRTYAAARRRWPSLAQPERTGRARCDKCHRVGWTSNPRALCVGRASSSSCEPRPCRLVEPAGTPRDVVRAETRRERSDSSDASYDSSSDSSDSESDEEGGGRRVRRHRLWNVPAAAR